MIAAANQARDAKADLIVTVGGGSITDGAKAVQLCLANDVSDVEGIDAERLRPLAARVDLDRERSLENTQTDPSFYCIDGTQRSWVEMSDALEYLMSCIATHERTNPWAP